MNDQKKKKRLPSPNLQKFVSQPQPFSHYHSNQNHWYLDQACQLLPNIVFLKVLYLDFICGLSFIPHPGSFFSINSSNLAVKPGLKPLSAFHLTSRASSNKHSTNLSSSSGVHWNLVPFFPSLIGSLDVFSMSMQKLNIIHNYPNKNVSTAFLRKELYKKFTMVIKINKLCKRTKNTRKKYHQLKFYYKTNSWNS